MIQNVPRNFTLFTKELIRKSIIDELYNTTREEIYNK